MSGALTGNVDGSVSVLSVSQTGLGVMGVLPANLTSNSQTNTGTGQGAVVSAGSASSSTFGTLGAAVGETQTVSAAWTGNLVGRATFTDNWSTSNVATGKYNAVQNFGLGTGVPASATFTFNMAAAGTYSINWNALETGNQTFGLLNMVAVIDGGVQVQVSPVNASAATPTGSFTGTLSAGIHTIVLKDLSNYRVVSQFEILTFDRLATSKL
ncbi:MAG: hypothetical protein POG74_12490 [Acidocella sp.]|nr:hypothetical protein [Acidocella sp.]